MEIKIEILMDGVSITRHIPFEVFDGERKYRGTVIETITSVGGMPIQDVEIEWEKDESPDNVTDDEVIEAYENQLR